MALANPVGQHSRGARPQVRARLDLAASLGVPRLAGCDDVGLGGCIDTIACLTPHGLSPEQARAAGSTGHVVGGGGGDARGACGRGAV
jgi:hypothetical protein